MKQMPFRIAGPGAIVLAGLCALAADPSPEAVGTAESSESLEWAFKFATAIDPDPKDKAEAQEQVVLEYAKTGHLEMAVKLAGEIDGWRKGTALADLAGLYYDAGRPDEATVLIESAMNVRRQIKTWEGPRIEAHVAKVQAKLGRIDSVAATSESLVREDPRQYGGQGTAMVAVGRAASGEFEEAMSQLDVMGQTKGLEAAWWRFEAYLDLARHSGLNGEQRSRALDEACSAARIVPGWVRARALAEVSLALSESGRRDPAAEAAAAADEAIRSMAASEPARGPILGQVARAWALAGKETEARKLLETGESEATGVRVARVPFNYAALASGYAALGDMTAANRLYSMAMSAAEDLVNARPRALAVVDICRTMGRDDIAPDEQTRERLENLYRGLDDPW